jgi:DNA polymerase I-like protein with 3'-5' exonuclease and polymerase domains
LVFEIADSAVESSIASIREIMCSSTPLDVPLIVYIGMGDNWDEAH